MAMANPARGLRDPLRMVKSSASWYIAAGVLFILLGGFAIVEPAVAALGVTFFVGWLLIMAAITHFIGMFRGNGAKQALFQGLIAIAYGIAGVYFLLHPLLAIGTLTLLLAAVILAGGVLEVISHFRLRREEPSGWMLLNGIVALFVGGLIWFHWPSSSVWSIGTLVGLRLLVSGFTRLTLGLTARKVAW